MKRDVACFFRDALREARAAALLDSEAFGKIIVVIERLGNFQAKSNNKSLAQIKNYLLLLVQESPLAQVLPEAWPAYHQTFDSLFDMVRESRNTAVHEGALARHLTTHAMARSFSWEQAMKRSCQQLGKA